MSIDVRKLVPVFCSFAIVGCVSTSKYRRQVDQMTALTSQKQALEQDLAAAKLENGKLIGDLEAKKDELKKRVGELSEGNRDLLQKLRETEQAKEMEINRLKGTYDQLVGGLKEEIAAGQIKITNLEGKLSVNLVEKILFDSGEARIKSKGEGVLSRVAAILKKVQDKDIRIEGHTDNVPIGQALRDKFPTNWELSTARASAVARYLQEDGKIDGQRLIAAGYGEYRPIVPNDSPEHKAENRRIEIVLVPREPVATSATVPASIPPPAPPKP